MTDDLRQCYPAPDFAEVIYMDKDGATCRDFGIFNHNDILAVYRLEKIVKTKVIPAQTILEDVG